MRILFITHRLPCPPDRGCKVRSAAILQWLAGRHDVWCAGFLEVGGPAELREEAQRSLTSLRHLCRGVLAVPFRPRLAGYKALAGLIAGRTATEGYFSSRALIDGVRTWSSQVDFDAAFAFSSGIAPVALRVPATRRVLCMDDLDSRKWRDLAEGRRWPSRLIYDTEARRLARREIEWIEAFDATLMVSRREADLIDEPRLRARVHVIPPVLPALPEAPSPPLPVPDTDPIVGFVGAMDYGPNADAACWFAREIWPRVQRRCPAARFWIVGRSPTPAVRDLARDESVVVSGTVADVGEYLGRMRVHVAPLRVSRGVQIKVLAAMAAARPCVVTSSVADGLGARGGRDLMIADSPALFAQTVADLIENTGRAEAIGRAGQAFLHRIDPERAMRRIETLLSGDEAPDWDEHREARAELAAAAEPRECALAR